jgi:two-component system, NarL family, sensor histidine kinase UhpB
MMSWPRLRRAAVRVPLFWRISGVNAVLLVAAAVGLAVSPATVSSELLLRELVVLGIGVLLVLTLNTVLVSHTLDPLERLTRFMRRVDLLQPGQRLPVAGGGPEVEALTAAFNAMLDRLEAERRESGRRAIEAQEQERRRLALELHDEVGQTLAGVVLGLDGLARDMPADVRRRVHRMQDLVRDGAEQVRDLARGLRPESLEAFGLRAALVGLLGGVAETSGLRVRRRIDAGLPALAPEAELVVYRVAQESLANAIRHGEATTIDFSVEERDRTVELRVRDDGRGIDPGALTSPRGLRGMRERAVSVGGALDVGPVGPHGTEVRLRVPTRMSEL